MGVFCDRLKLYSTAALPDWPKQRQRLQKRALISTRLIAIYLNLVFFSKQQEVGIMDFLELRLYILLK